MIVFNSIDKFITGSDDVQRQINFMDDGFSAEKMGASERIDFPKKWSEWRSDDFFSRNWFPTKMGRAK